jgi:hypothetical protein
MLIIVTRGEELLHHLAGGKGATLTLALFVAGIGADDVDHAAAAYDLAMLANSLDAGSDFHSW